MALMVKPWLLGTLAVAAVAVVIGVGVNLLDASGAVAGTAFVVGAAIAGLIGGEISRRLPPPQQH